ncbi:MAG: ATP-dependent DNA helicase, partial [Sphingobacteriales bacterium]
TCTFAFNFYFKLDAARQAAYEIPLLDKSALTALAHEFKICPFYLSMEMSRWVDIVVADVNYYFDGTPLLLSLTNEFDWKPYLLIDESHNLIDRGRSMYSSELSRSDLLNAKNCAPVAIKKSLEKIDTSWIELINTFPKDVENFYLLPTTSDKMNQAITEFTSIYIEFLQKNPEHPVQESFVQNFFFSSLNYQGLLEILDEDFCIDMQSIGTKKEILTLRNLIPATPLSRRLSAAHCACYFSATLHPPYYYQSLLGLPEDTAFIKVPSPFKPEQLDIKIANTLSTRYKDRESSLAPMCKIIEQQISEAPGNALIFFPSYDFLKKVELVLGSTLKDSNVRMLVQSNRMNEIDRQEFIEQFSSHNNLLGLAVLGGAFSEGIDLSGDALKGVFIATLGLPQVNPINEYLRSVMQTKFLRGYDFTYTYPGIQKVVQAAGRVIRTKNDTGYLWLLDERYEQQDIRHLLPDWWNLP